MIMQRIAYIQSGMCKDEEMSLKFSKHYLIPLICDVSGFFVFSLIPTFQFNLTKRTRYVLFVCVCVCELRPFFIHIKCIIMQRVSTSTIHLLVPSFGRHKIAHFFFFFAFACTIYLFFLYFNGFVGCCVLFLYLVTSSSSSLSFTT